MVAYVRTSNINTLIEAAVLRRRSPCAMALSMLMASRLAADYA